MGKNRLPLVFLRALHRSTPHMLNSYDNARSFLSLQFNDMVNVPFSSEPFVAGIIAYFLDNTLHKKGDAIKKDRGKHWWAKFKSFKGDTRSEEFYSLPFNLNKYFPSVWFVGLSVNAAAAAAAAAASLSGSVENEKIGFIVLLIYCE